MKNGFKLLSVSALCTLALTSFPVLSFAGSVEQPAPKPFNYMPRFSTGPFYQTHHDSFGLFDVFVPFTFSPDSLVFVDGRYIDRGNSSETNIGLGIRNITPSGNFLWTLYSFYDNRKSKFGNYFGQVTVGADFQTENWYANTNAYIPVGRTQAFTGQNNIAYISGSNIYYQAGIERSMGGWDAEVGRTIFAGLKGYVGAYVFERSGVKTAAGPKFRLQYDLFRHDQKRLLYIFDNIAFIADYRTDNLVGSSWYSGVRFDIGLGPNPHMTGLQNKMTSFVRRDINVELSSDGNGIVRQSPQLLHNANGSVTRVAQVNTAAAFDTARADTSVNIIGVRGGITMSGDDQALSNGQVLEGGNYGFMREGQSFSVAAGSNGSLTRANGAGAMIDVGSNNLIENMTFVRTGASATATYAIHDGVGGTVDSGSLVIRNNRFTDTAVLGVTAGAAGQIENVSFTNNTASFTAAGVGVDGSVFSMVDFIGGAATNTGRINADVESNTVISTKSQLAGIRFLGSALATLTGVIKNNSIDVSPGGAPQPALYLDGSLGHIDVLQDMSGNEFRNRTNVNGVRIEDNVTFHGDVWGNFIGDIGTGGEEGALHIDSDNSPGAGVIFEGAFRNNTLTSAGEVVVLNAQQGASLLFKGGIINNSFTTASATDNAFQIVDVFTGPANVLINGFRGNTFSVGGTGDMINFNLGTAGTPAGSLVQVYTGGSAGGTAGLAAANNIVDPADVRIEAQTAGVTINIDSGYQP